MLFIKFCLDMAHQAQVVHSKILKLEQGNTYCMRKELISFPGLIMDSGGISFNRYILYHPCMMQDKYQEQKVDIFIVLCMSTSGDVMGCKLD